MSDSPRPENDGSSSSTPAGDDLPEFDLDGIEIPDDLSSLTGTGEPEFAALITQIAGAEPLAAASPISPGALADRKKIHPPASSGPMR